MNLRNNTSPTAIISRPIASSCISPVTSIEYHHGIPRMAIDSTSSVSHGPCSSLSIRRQFNRAGIIPYGYVDKERWFFLCVDSRTYDCTDFGGTSKHSLGETFLEASTREAYEESLGVFDWRRQLAKVHAASYAVWSDDNSMVLLLTPISITDSFLLDTRKKESIHILHSGEISTLIEPSRILNHRHTPEETEGILPVKESDFLSLIRRRPGERVVVSEPLTRRIAAPIMYDVVSSRLSFLINDDKLCF